MRESHFLSTFEKATRPDADSADKACILVAYASSPNLILAPGVGDLVQSPSSNPSRFKTSGVACLQRTMYDPCRLPEPNFPLKRTLLYAHGRPFFLVLKVSPHF